MAVKICLICNNAFSVSNHRNDTAKYCSVQCRIASQNQKIITICMGCNKPFQHYKSLTPKTCSYKCRGKIEFKIINHKSCKHCHNMFIPSGKSVNHCSIYCKLYSKIEKTDTCWKWLGKGDKNGYGKITIEGKPYRSHRVMYELHHGKIPENYYVCHTCDNPSCVNPEHFFLGTALDNNRDKIKKGRAFYGFKPGHNLSPKKKD